MEVSGQLHAPVALSPGKEPLAPIGLEARKNGAMCYKIKKANT